MSTRFTTVYTPRSTKKRKTTISCIPDFDKCPVQVYCRLKPLADNQNSKSNISLKTPQELCVSTELKGMRRDISYKFNHIFTADISQKEVFNHVAYPLLQDLLNGKNGLLFTYGVTGSGKTYTLTGDNNNLDGIIPRCIQTIFNSINEEQTDKFLIKSDKMNGYEIQTEEEAFKDRRLESKKLPQTPKSGRKVDKFNFPVFPNNDTKILNLNNNLYSVFVSYIEIYNNNVYDLLDECSIGKPLQSKILREDPNHNMYVNGLVEVEVKSAYEALDIFLTGHMRKKTASTNLNSESSRSHSIFNIRIVHLKTNSLNGESLLNVSQMSLVDLAGSERSNRTQNTGQRLKEASSINNSLMTLRTCLEILKENQQNRGNKIVPYRDSRLTYLFRNYFEGDGSIQMIVCVNPSTDNLEENMQVMKFAEMTQDIKILKAEPKFTPVSTKKILKPILTPKLTKTKLFFTGPDIPTFKFNVNEPDECGRAIENLLKSLKEDALKHKEINSEINKKSTELRKHLVEVENKIVHNKADVGNLNKLLNKQKIKNNNLEMKLNRLETESKSLLDKNKELEQIFRSSHATENKRKVLKINPSTFERKYIKPKPSLMNEKSNRNVLKSKIQNGDQEVSVAVKNVNVEGCKELFKSDMMVDPEGLELENISVPSHLFDTLRSELTPATMEGHVPRRRSRSVDEVLLKPNSLRINLQLCAKKRKSTAVLVDVTSPKQYKCCTSIPEFDVDDQLEAKKIIGSDVIKHVVSDVVLTKKD